MTKKTECDDSEFNPTPEINMTQIEVDMQFLVAICSRLQSGMTRTEALIVSDIESRLQTMKKMDRLAFLIAMEESP